MKNQAKITKRIFSGLYSIVLMSFSFLLITTAAFGQESVEINGQDVGSWFERNWMWV